MKRQVVGVFDKKLLKIFAEALKNLKLKKALIVNSEDGLDEISPYAKTNVVELEGESIKEFILDPKEMGIKIISIHVLLLPNLNVVLSLKYPAMGSDTASHILDILKMTPITAGAMSSTSVENFMTYRLIKRYI